ncbi:hypothetical protein [Rossellomorea aquimaris]|uniref:hypothetical protein n=1 Tax=Rossellomorea aquimaris TaxID=189382 RepID=UPI000AD498B2|nr:hypothetical protein [Rossellomorea aquimaris]
MEVTIMGVFFYVILFLGIFVFIQNRLRSRNDKINKMEKRMNRLEDDVEERKS